MNKLLNAYLGNGSKLHKDNFAPRVSFVRNTNLHGGSFLHESKKNSKKYIKKTEKKNKKKRKQKEKKILTDLRVRLRGKSDSKKQIF